MERTTEKNIDCNEYRIKDGLTEIAINRLGRYEATGLTPEQIEAQQQEIEKLTAEWGKSFRLRLEAEAEIERLSKKVDTQAERIMKMDEALKEAISSITAGRLCSIGSINNTYSAQISKSQVDRWRAMLGGAEDERNA